MTSHMIWWQRQLCGYGSMLSAVIATRESERALVPTLSALVPASASGLLAEVVIADAGSSDATAEVADIAGCRFLSSNAPLGARLKAAAATTKTPWLLFLRAGLVPQPGWIPAADHFIQTASLSDSPAQAAVFRSPVAGVTEFLRVALGGGPRPEQGLLISRRLYETLGGHSPDEVAERKLLRRLGRQRTALLSVSVSTIG